MGQIADDIRDGWCCQRCAIYFVEEHGYPVVCHECWDQSTRSEQRDLVLATHAELGGDVE